MTAGIKITRSASVIERILNHLNDNITKQGLALATEMTMEIDRKWSGIYPPASLPGQPPAIRTGKLRKSAHITATRSGKVFTFEIVYRVPYAAALEYGVPRKMAARPFLRPVMHAFVKNPEFVRRWKAAMTDRE